MPSVNWRNILWRAGWTFVEGFLSFSQVLPYITDHTGWVNLANSAIGGGLAALISFTKTLAGEMVKPTPPQEPLKP
jgi:phosphotransferase system  glucose/maltose/N-acetylglucosamine-specific IIC component